MSDTIIDFGGLQDWSRHAVGNLDGGEYEVVGENETATEDKATTRNVDNQENSNSYLKDYLPVYDGMYNNKIGAYNLGLYLQREYKDQTNYYVRSTQYVGMMPLLPVEKTARGGKDKQKRIVKIRSRFLDPIDMLHTVMSGDDFYENPNMLKVKVFTEKQWLEYKWGGNGLNKEKILFGVIDGIGKINLEYAEEQKENAFGLIDTYGIIEVIDFFAKAKKVCSRNLKRQMERVDENLSCKVKGRINIPKQIKYNAIRGHSERMYCTYNKMSTNNIENIILKYAIYLCQKLPNRIADCLQEDIQFCNNALVGVPLRRCSLSDFAGLKNNGAYREYKEALEAAKKVMSRYHIAYKSDGSSEAQVSGNDIQPFFIDMNILFELYARAVVRKWLDAFNGANKEKGITLVLESASLAERRLFKEDNSAYMDKYIPDIVINAKNSAGKETPIIILDAKYSDVEDMDSMKRSRTHQILFYMKALDVDYAGLISPLITPKNQDDLGKQDNYQEGSAFNSSKVCVNQKEENGIELAHIKIGTNVQEEDYCLDEDIKGYILRGYERGLEKQYEKEILSRIQLCYLKDTIKGKDEKSRLSGLRDCITEWNEIRNSDDTRKQDKQEDESDE